VSFDASTRSVTRTGVEKFLRKATCVSVFFFSKILESARVPVLKVTNIVKQIVMNSSISGLGN